MHVVCTSCWRTMRNKTSEGSKQVRFLIQKQRVRKYRTVQSTLHVFCVYIDIPPSASLIYFKSFKNAKITWWNHMWKNIILWFWLEVSFISCQKRRSLLRLARTPSHMKIYNITFQCQGISQTESMRKLSNFNFQRTKTLYQNNLKHNLMYYFLHFSRAVDICNNTKLSVSTSFLFCNRASIHLILTATDIHPPLIEILLSKRYRSVVDRLYLCHAVKNTQPIRIQ